MKTLKIAIFVFLPACFFLTSCGRKMTPTPPDGSKCIYPRIYPAPELEASKV